MRPLPKGASTFGKRKIDVSSILDPALFTVLDLDFMKLRKDEVELR